MAGRQDRATELFDLLVSSPDGLTVPYLREKLSWRENHAREAIHDLRLMFGEIDEINLICEPIDGRGPWTYRLVGTTEDADEWTQIRMRDIDSRMVTVHALTRSLVKATDGRSSTGRKARLLERTFRHLIEDLEALRDTGAA